MGTTTGPQLISNVLLKSNDTYIYISVCNQVFQCNKEQVSAFIKIDLNPNLGFLKSADCSMLRTLVEMSFLNMIHSLNSLKGCYIGDYIGD